MPDLLGADYVAAAFTEVGACKSNGMGRVPIDWVDVASYAQFNEIGRWEAKQIIAMSRTYVNAIETLDKQYSPPPYCADEELALQQQREVIRQKRIARMKAAAK